MAYRTKDKETAPALGFTDERDINLKDKMVDDDAKYDVRCGYGSCKPERLQACNNPKILLAIICVFAVSQGFVVNGINNVNTQSVERRFRLPSSRSGLISSSYDFSAAIFGVFISFFASGRHKPRWLTAGAIVLGLGSFTMALPHFTTGLYEWGQNEPLRTCQPGQNLTNTACANDGLSNYLGVLMFGMILHGVGGCILYTVGVGMLDDSVTEIKSPLFLGIFYGAAALGPGLGYIIGGQFLNMYVDFDKVDVNNIDLDANDPRWVGAWWASFFITMSVAWIIAVPLSMFGAELPTAKKIRESRVSQMHKGSLDSSDGHGTSKRLPIKMFHKVIWSLLRNPAFVFTMLAGASEGILTSGFATFVPKFIQNQFGVSSASAAFYTGAAAVPGAAGGMFFGGFICNRLKLKVRGMFKFSIITCLITIVAINILWINCEGVPFAGVNKEYETGGDKLNIISACNEDCGCTTQYFDGVCASTGVQYFSACHAGCTNVTETADGEKVYSDCGCVNNANSSETVTMKEGRCESGCVMMYLFLALFFVTIFLTFLPSTPSDAATLRCIHEDHRTFSLGIKWLFIRLLGTVPGPVLFGAVTDIACRVWQTECGENTSCWIYDSSILSRNYFLIALGVKILSIIFFSLAYCLYKPPNEKDEIVRRESARKQMSFLNGSFRESDYEHKVLENAPSKSINGTEQNRTTCL